MEKKSQVAPSWPGERNEFGLNLIKCTQRSKEKNVNKIHKQKKEVVNVTSHVIASGSGHHSQSGWEMPGTENLFPGKNPSTASTESNVSRSEKRIKKNFNNGAI